MSGAELVRAITDAMISPNECDRNLEPANLVDGLFAIARAVEATGAAEFRNGTIDETKRSLRLRPDGENRHLKAADGGACCLDEATERINDEREALLVRLAGTVTQLHEAFVEALHLGEKRLGDIEARSVHDSSSMSGPELESPNMAMSIEEAGDSSGAGVSSTSPGTVTPAADVLNCVRDARAKVARLYIDSRFDNDIEGNIHAALLNLDSAIRRMEAVS